MSSPRSAPPDARGRGGEGELCAAVTYLLSPAAAFVSGETLRVDGAGSLWRKPWDIEDHEAIPPFDGYAESPLACSTG